VLRTDLSIEPLECRAIVDINVSLVLDISDAHNDHGEGSAMAVEVVLCFHVFLQVF
jgi:hypothetical protein